MTGRSVASLALAGIPADASRSLVGLGALAVGFGVALLATAGYLISRAAEQPPILSLDDDDRRRALLRRSRGRSRATSSGSSSHDLALRVARAAPRTRFYAAHRAARAGRARGVPARRPARAAWSATSTRSRALYLRGIGPPLVALAVAVACVVATALLLPAAALVLAAGCSLGGIAVPLLGARLVRGGRRARQAAARGELTAELVELLRGAPELVAYGREDDALARVRTADRELARLGRRDALVAGCGRRRLDRSSPA